MHSRDGRSRDLASVHAFGALGVWTRHSLLAAQVLLAWSPGAQLAYVGQVAVHSRDRHGGRFVRRMEHLMCYLPGAARPVPLLPNQCHVANAKVTLQPPMPLLAFSTQS